MSNINLTQETKKLILVENETKKTLLLKEYGIIKSQPLAASFLDLTDTPTNYAGQADMVLAVSPDESGLIFTERASVAVTSVAGKTGDVILVEADITDSDKYTQNEVDTLLLGKADTGDVFSGSYTDLTDTPTEFTPEAHTHLEVDITDLDKYTQLEVDTLINETFSGSYNDLTDVPTTFDPSAHSHLEVDITDLDKYTQNEVDTLLTDKLDRTGGIMTGHLLFDPDQHLLFRNSLFQDIAGLGISSNYHTSPSLEFIIAGDRAVGPTPTPTDIRIHSSRISLDAEAVHISVPGSEQGSRLISAGHDLDGNAILAWEQPPVPAYEEVSSGVLGTNDQDLGTGSPPTVWVKITDDATLSQDIALQEGLWYYQVLLQNKTSNRTGTIGLGLGINGSAPTEPIVTSYVDKSEKSITSGTLRNNTPYNTGDTFALYARIENSDNIQFGIDVIGSEMPSEITMSIRGSGGTTGVPEAPINGQAYVRQDATWVLFTDTDINGGTY